MTYQRCHATCQGALTAAAHMADAYGDNYVILKTERGFAAVREQDLGQFSGRGWWVVSHHRPNKNHNQRPKRKVFDNTLYNATSQDVLNTEATHGI